MSLNINVKSDNNKNSRNVAFTQSDPLPSIYMEVNGNDER